MLLNLSAGRGRVTSSVLIISEHQMGEVMRDKDSNKVSKSVKTGDKTTVDQQKRRKLLGAIAAGGAATTLLPQKWSKPVVDSVMLPAHAQMSPGALVDCTVTGYLLSGTISFSQSASSFFVPSTSPSTFTDASSSGTTSVSSVAFTFAALTGIGTYTGSASFVFTSATITGTAVAGINVTQSISWIFDSTCSG